MTLKVKILADLEKRLNAITKPTKGQLHAVYYNRNCLVVGANWFGETVTCWKEAKLQGFHHHYPTGVDLCGMVFVHTSDNIPDVQNESASELKNVIVTDNPLVITKDLSSDSLSVKISLDGHLTQHEYEVMSKEEFDREFLLILVKSEVQLTIASTLEATLQQFESAKKMTGVETGILFNVSGSDVYVNDKQESGQLVDLFKNYAHSRDPRLNKGILDVISMFPVTGNVQIEGCRAPEFLIHDQCEGEREISVQLEGLCLTHITREFNNVYGLFIDALCRSLHLARSVISRMYPELKTVKNENSLKFYHFYPEVLGHPLSTCSIDGLPEKIRKNFIEELHESLNIPKFEGPVFTKGAAISFDSSLLGPLLNVHEGLRKSKVVDGKVSLVKGIYSYYHYLQNNYDDCGWGCAYRSFQTIFSWFRWQGYTDRKVPTHKEIQECLVAIGDKPKSFVGTKNWIGSNEIAFCLQSLINVDCRILTKSSGRELATIGPDLDAHFESQGTPVMIGGGQLAHTILGVDYNEETDSISFLVLDPHYTGKDAIKDIQSKGVGWKGLDFWDKNSFYNLCLPLKNRSVFY